MRSASPTSRRARPDRAGAGAGRRAVGLGLGFFIAKTLLERSGATVTLDNREQPGTGAVARVSWPREVFESRRPLSVPPPEAGRRPQPAMVPRAGGKSAGSLTVCRKAWVQPSSCAIYGQHAEASTVAEDLSFKQDELPEDRSLILVDDDRAFLQRLARPWRRAASRCARRIRSPRAST